MRDPLSPPPQGVSIVFATSISVGIYVYVSPVNIEAAITDVHVLPTQATVKLRNDGDCPLRVEGRCEFIRPGEKRPTAVARIGRGVLLPEPVNTAIFTAALPDQRALPSGRYLVRVILDIGLDHYIGVQKEVEVKRAAGSPPENQG